VARPLVAARDRIRRDVPPIALSLVAGLQRARHRRDGVAGTEIVPLAFLIVLLAVVDVAVVSLSLDAQLSNPPADAVLGT